MLKRFLARDRMVMTGLVVLGVLAVAAGFVSGRSTFQYALSTDARQAAIVWVERVERQIAQQERPYEIEEVAGQPVKVLAPGMLARLKQMPVTSGLSDIRIARSVHEESGLLAGIDHLFAGWINGLTELLDADSHVSQIKNFALLDSDGKPVFRSRGFTPFALGNLIGSSGFRAELYKSLGNHSTRIINDFALPGEEISEFRKLLLVPVLDGRSVSRIYALDVDQSSAATMSKVALIAASMMTSLLIVLSYSIPAAIAFRRIRERWKAEDQIRFLAMHDPLTGLPNRVQMQNRLQQAVGRAKRHNKLMAVMCLDLDRFKDVNDTLGHQTGDLMLREAAERLRECVRESDVVSRLGGDEFAVITEDLDAADDAIPIARRICEKLSSTFEVNGHSIATSGSVGITFGPTEGDDPDSLLNNADLALYRAKNDGRNTFRFFEPEMDRAVQDRRRKANDLRRALRNNELRLHYQPQFDLKTGELTGYEALARWTHPEDGEIPPKEFIPIAEECGLIGQLGEWVLKNACQYARDWPEDTTLSVNISPAQFRAQDIVATVRDALNATGFPARRLLLEITENLLLKNTDETVQTLKELTGLGVSLALDDFGTGYSSLSYLTRFPVAKIKIDQSFIGQMEADQETSAIVNTIVGLGRSLDVTITAEGVETERQADILRRIGCNEVQGFLFGRPAPTIVTAPFTPQGMQGKTPAANQGTKAGPAISETAQAGPAHPVPGASTAASEPAAQG